MLNNDRLTPSELTARLLLFRTQDTLVCIELAFVQRVLPLMALCPLPDSPPAFAGFLDLHGDGVPVIDLGIHLGLAKAKAYCIDTPLILCQDQQHTTGLLVDEIIGVITPRAEAFQHQQSLTHTGQRIQGIVRTDHGLALLLSSEAFLDVALQAAPAQA
jgi:chemotaxis signal transduction protein